MTAKTELSAPKRRTRAEVQQLVAEFVSSGMRRSEFCQSRGLSFSTLDRHLMKHNRHSLIFRHGLLLVWELRECKLERKAGNELFPTVSIGRLLQQPFQSRRVSSPL
jgi:DNA-binding transcriptional ArsR family regulator